MRWKALATDFDGTLAHEGVVELAALQAMADLRAAGVKVVLVTGRELSDFPKIDFPLSGFDLVVAENGALLHNPASGDVRGLGAPPPAHFVAELIRRGVDPISVGASIVATVEPFEREALEVIKEMGLEHQVIFNKGAVMILPPGVNKATGLETALAELHIDRIDVVGVGDGENDHALLKMCGLAVAVENAIPALKENADWVTVAPASAGLAALMQAMLKGELDHLGAPEVAA